MPKLKIVSLPEEVQFQATDSFSYVGKTGNKGTIEAQEACTRWELLLESEDGFTLPFTLPPHLPEETRKSYAIGDYLVISCRKFSDIYDLRLDIDAVKKHMPVKESATNKKLTN